MAMFGGGGAIGTGIVINLYDQFSANADKIANKFKTLEGTSEIAAQSIEASLNKMKIGFAAIAIGGMLLAPLIGSVGTTIALEEKMADVRKTTGMTADEAMRLKTALYDLDTRTSIDDLLGIAEIGGQIGIAKDEIESFTGAVDKVTVALGDEFSGGVEEVSSTLGILRNTFSDMRSNDVADDMLKIGNALNELGAAGFATAPVVSDFANRIGGIGIPLGLSTGQVLGLSATLQELGVNAERGGTAVSSILKKMLTDTQGFSKLAGVSVGEFKDIIASKDPDKGLYGAFQRVMEGSQRFKGDAVGLAKALDKLGIDGAGASEVFLKLGSRMDLLDERTTLANEALKGTGSILAEFGVKNETTQAMLDKLNKNFVELKDNLGQAILPLLKPLIGLLMGFGKMLAWIANTKVGRALIVLTGIVGAFAVAIGVAVVAINAKKWATGQLSQALLALGKTELATTFLTKGLAAGFREAAASLAPLMLEMLPFIIAGAVIVGVFLLLKKAVDSFKDVMEGAAEPANGLLGVFQKLGGVLFALGEVWASATNDGFTMTEKTAKALEKLGIYELVLNLATWVVRLKAFFTGMGETIWEVLTAVGQVVTWLWSQMVKLAAVFGIDISKNLSDINAWIAAGKILGYVIGAIIVVWLIIMIANMISLAAAVLLATWPLILLIAIIYGIYYAITHWGEITDWLTAKWGEFATWIEGILSDIGDWFSETWEWISNAVIGAIEGIWDYVVGWFSFMMSLPGMFVDFGINMVTAIWEGIVSSWDWLKTSFIGLISELPGGSILLDFFGVGGDEETGGGGGVSTPNPDDDPELSPLGVANSNGRVAAMGGGGRTETYNTNESKEVLQTVILKVDGKQIKTQMDKIDRSQNNRRN